MGRHVPKLATMPCKHCVVGAIPTLSTILNGERSYGMKKNSLLVGAVALIAAALTVLANPLTLQWSPSPDDKGTNFVTYAVYQANGATAPFVNVGNVGTNLTYTTNITPGLYRFYVTAVNFWNVESDPSNIASTPSTNAVAPPTQPILYVVVGSKTNIVKF